MKDRIHSLTSLRYVWRVSPNANSPLGWRRKTVVPMGKTEKSGKRRIEFKMSVSRWVVLTRQSTGLNYTKSNLNFWAASPDGMKRVSELRLLCCPSLSLAATLVSSHPSKLPLWPVSEWSQIFKALRLASPRASCRLLLRLPHQVGITNLLADVVVIVENSLW